LKSEDEESAPRNSNGADKNKARKKKSTSHNHIGPNVRAFRAGVAFCPVCDAERGLRLTDRERDSERTVKETVRSSRDFSRNRR